MTGSVGVPDRFHNPLFQATDLDGAPEDRVSKPTWRSCSRRTLWTEHSPGNRGGCPKETMLNEIASGSGMTTLLSRSGDLFSPGG